MFARRVLAPMRHTLLVLSGAMLLAACQDQVGESVGRVQSAEDGSFSVLLRAGRYLLVPQPVEGLLGTAVAVEVVVEDGNPIDPVEIIYDTGIR